MSQARENNQSIQSLYTALSQGVFKDFSLSSRIKLAISLLSKVAELHSKTPPLVHNNINPDTIFYNPETNELSFKEDFQGVCVRKRADITCTSDREYFSYIRNQGDVFEGEAGQDYIYSAYPVNDIYSLAILLTRLFQKEFVSLPEGKRQFPSNFFIDPACFERMIYRDTDKYGDFHTRLRFIIQRMIEVKFYGSFSMKNVLEEFRQFENDYENNLQKPWGKREELEYHLFNFLNIDRATALKKNVNEIIKKKSDLLEISNYWESLNRDINYANEKKEQYCKDYADFQDTINEAYKEVQSCLLGVKYELEIYVQASIVEQINLLRTKKISPSAFKAEKDKITTLCQRLQKKGILLSQQMEQLDQLTEKSSGITTTQSYIQAPTVISIKLSKQKKLVGFDTIEATQHFLKYLYDLVKSNPTVEWFSKEDIMVGGNCFSLMQDEKGRYILMPSKKLTLKGPKSGSFNKFKLGYELIKDTQSNTFRRGKKLGVKKQKEALTIPLLFVKNRRFTKELPETFYLYEIDTNTVFYHDKDKGECTLVSDIPQGVKDLILKRDNISGVGVHDNEIYSYIQDANFVYTHLIKNKHAPGQLGKEYYPTVEFHPQSEKVSKQTIFKAKSNSIRTFVVEPHAKGKENLLEYLVSGKARKLSISDRLSMILSLIQEVGETHTKEGVYCDIKPENMVVDEKSKKITLIDRGSNLKVGKKLEVMSPIYSPYEVGISTNNESFRVDYSFDIFSLGIVILQIVFVGHNSDKSSYTDRNDYLLSTPALKKRAEYIMEKGIEGAMLLDIEIPDFTSVFACFMSSLYQITRFSDQIQAILAQMLNRDIKQRPLCPALYDFFVHFKNDYESALDLEKQQLVQKENDSLKALVDFKAKIDSIKTSFKQHIDFITTIDGLSKLLHQALQELVAEWDKLKVDVAPIAAFSEQIQNEITAIQQAVDQFTYELSQLTDKKKNQIFKDTLDSITKACQSWIEANENQLDQMDLNHEGVDQWLTRFVNEVDQQIQSFKQKISHLNKLKEGNQTILHKAMHSYETKLLNQKAKANDMKAALERIKIFESNFTQFRNCYFEEASQDVKNLLLAKASELLILVEQTQRDANHYKIPFNITKETIQSILDQKRETFSQICSFEEQIKKLPITSSNEIQLDNLSLKELKQAQEQWIIYRNILEEAVPVTEAQKMEKEDLLKIVREVLQAISLTQSEITKFNVYITRLKGQLANLHEQREKALKDYYSGEAYLSSYIKCHIALSHLQEKAENEFSAPNEFHDLSLFSLDQEQSICKLKSNFERRLKESIAELSNNYPETRIPDFIVDTENEVAIDRQYQDYLTRLTPFKEDNKKVQVILMSEDAKRYIKDEEIQHYKDEIAEINNALTRAERNAGSQRDLFMKRIDQTRGQIQAVNVPAFEIAINAELTVEAQRLLYQNQMLRMADLVDRIIISLGGDRELYGEVERKHLLAEAENKKTEIRQGQVAAQNIVQTYNQRFETVNNSITEVAIGDGAADLRTAITTLKNIQQAQFQSFVLTDRKALFEQMTQKMSEALNRASQLSPQDRLTWIIDALTNLNNDAQVNELLEHIQNRKVLFNQDAEILFPVLLAAYKMKQNVDLLEDQEEQKALDRLLAYLQEGKNPKFKLLAWIAIIILALLLITCIIGLAAPITGIMAFLGALATFVAELAVAAYTALTSLFIGMSMGAAGMVAGATTLGGIMTASVGGLSAIGAGIFSVHKAVCFFNEKEHRNSMENIHGSASAILNQNQ